MSEKVKVFLIKIDGAFHRESHSFEEARALTKSLCSTGRTASMVSMSIAAVELQAFLRGQRKSLRPEKYEQRKSG